MDPARRQRRLRDLQGLAGRQLHGHEHPRAAVAQRRAHHGPGARASFDGSVGWYRTRFRVPSTGSYAIRFESVNHRAGVWLDGRKLGEHVGTSLPFEFDAELAAGRDHLLVVRADWRNPIAMKREGWHRTWFNYGGINREVTVRPIGPSVLSAPTVRTRLPEGARGAAQVDVTVHVKNRMAAARDIPVRGALVRDGVRHEIRFATLRVPGNATRVLSATVAVPDPALWAPGSPNLYDLELGVPGEASFAVRTGLREIRKAGTRMLLNGRPIVLRGASIHEDAKGRGDALTPADMDRVVAELKAIGANATRAQHPLDPALLERLDAAGIMVWQGVGPVDSPGAWTSTTARLRAQGRRRVRTTFFQDQTHPSIVVWNLANEVAGNGHDAGQVGFIDGVARELHQRDPGRLVGLDVWGAHPPKHAGRLYRNIDAIGDTNYIGWYEKLQAKRSVVRRAIRDHVAFFKRVFAGKVLVVTEFGAEANGANPDGKPGGYGFQARLLKLHIDTYRRIPGVSGMLVWNLRDFGVTPLFFGGSVRSAYPQIKLTRGLNQKGLFTYDGRAKPSVQVVRAALARVAADDARR